jgi:hypothetical protein
MADIVVQDKPTFGIDRAACQNGFMVRILRVFDVELLKNIIKAQLKGVVDDDAHGTLVAMFANISDAIGEDTLTEARHGDQEMILECVDIVCAHNPIIGSWRQGYKSVWPKVTI